MTTEEARKHREFAEHVIYTALKTLSKDTGLDLVSVNVHLIVRADEQDNPRRFAEAVRIELAV